MAKSRLLTVVTCLSLFGLFNVTQARTFSGFGAELDGYIRLAAERYQVSETMLRGLVKFEDGWDGKISPTGASGVGQFTVGTWNWLSETERGRQLGMAPVTKYNRGTRYDPRHNRFINTFATALLARWHIEQFSERRIPISDENLYMAHNIGLEGLHRALLGTSTRDDIKNMRRNGMKPWMGVADFMAYQKNRYNTHKYEANFLTPPKAVVATAAVQQPSSTVATSSDKTATAKPTRLIIPGKIRYIEPGQSNTDLAMRTQASKPKETRWVEPGFGKIVWIAPKNKQQ